MHKTDNDMALGMKCSKGRTLSVGRHKVQGTAIHRGPRRQYAGLQPVLIEVAQPFLAAKEAPMDLVVTL